MVDPCRDHGIMIMKGMDSCNPGIPVRYVLPSFFSEQDPFISAARFWTFMVVELPKELMAASGKMVGGSEIHSSCNVHIQRKPLYKVRCSILTKCAYPPNRSCHHGCFGKLCLTISV